MVPTFRLWFQKSFLSLGHKAILQLILLTVLPFPLTYLSHPKWRCLNRNTLSPLNIESHFFLTIVPNNPFFALFSGAIFNLCSSPQTYICHL